MQVFLDDFVVYSTRSEYFWHMCFCLERCRAARFSLNLAKCAFGVTSGTLSGHIVSSKGTATELEKIKEIIDTLAPKNTTVKTSTNARTSTIMGMVFVTIVDHRQTMGADTLNPEVMKLTENLKILDRGMKNPTTIGDGHQTTTKRIIEEGPKICDSTSTSTSPDPKTKTRDN